MCGISGLIDFSRSLPAEELQHRVDSMVLALQHRGPDDSGTYVNATSGVALGHDRLSILDLSPLGHQPMTSQSGRFVIVYNGEIFNFNDIRQELEARGHTFRGRSDTEVILAGVESWGVTNAIKRLAGQFALALFDTIEKKLHLCRDRVGKKPLYYGWAGRQFLFASELKALRIQPDFSGRISSESISYYLHLNFIPAPHTIYKDFRKLEPGMIVTIDAASSGIDRDLRPFPYWSISDLPTEFEQALSPDDASKRLEELLLTAVRERMIADVPLGAFLSGGIDSSLVVALMQAQSTNPVRTFTVRFSEKAFDESTFAREIAAHLNTDHTELPVTPQDALSVIPHLPTIYDEPFADSSQIPTYLISKLTRQHVTVALSGDGGDEVFGGYNRYVAGRSAWNVIQRIPLSLRPMFSSALLTLSPRRWDQIGRIASIQHLGDKAQKLAGAVRAQDFREYFFQLISIWKENLPLRVPDSSNTSLLFRDWREQGDVTRNMMLLDFRYCLPDDMLVKVDRASMAHALEVRCPLLDHRVVEFAWKLPLTSLIRGRRGKVVLRDILSKYVPPPLFERPKQGFSIPIAEWLRGPLKDWAFDSLSAPHLSKIGILEPRLIRARLDEHIAGRRNWHDSLWNILMLQAWFQETGSTT